MAAAATEACVTKLNQNEIADPEQTEFAELKQMIIDDGEEMLERLIVETIKIRSEGGLTCDFESIFGDCLNIETNENQVRDCLTKLVHNKTINIRTSRKRTIYNLSKDLSAPVVDVNNDLYIEIQKLHDELTDYKEYAESKFSQLSTEIIKLTKAQDNNSKIESPRSDSFTEKLEEEIKYLREENKNKTEVIKLLTTDAVDL